MDAELLKKRLEAELTIPTLPGAVARLEQLLADPDSGMGEIGAALALDPPLAARLLRVANSSSFGLRERVASLERAASFLGTGQLQRLLVEGSPGSILDRFEGHPDFDVAWLWRHSILVARLCQDIPADKVSGTARETRYLCGLLHDIGEFVLLEHLGDSYVELVLRTRAGGGDLHAAELETFGISHTGVGTIIGRRWSLPRPVEECIRYHHDAFGRAQRDPLVALVRVADRVARAVEAEPPASRPAVASGVLECLGILRTQLPDITELAREHLRSIVV